MTNLTDDQLKSLLTGAKTVVIVGASNKPERASNGIMKFLMKNGYTVYPVNPVEKEVLGVPTYDSVAEVPVKPDIVDVFRRSDVAAEVVREAIGREAGLIWLQEDVITEEGKRMAEYANIPFVMDRCIFKEYLRLGITG
ncbi:CoA-binding protein [Geovibrio thiophilus]|uniref:CoA-binding protein n=1 Tax=Geovibrio thiophilus TaxID=139438 RepID=A0A410JWA5_9BACT|nr:CoA-binding protein [Geovibrio thiophilus]QAR32433.1 CoA-binding protein [Geovibrio thiophilus]